MARQRPVAGQRNRSRLGGSRRSAEQPASRAGRPAAQAATDGRWRPRRPGVPPCWTAPRRTRRPAEHGRRGHAGPAGRRAPGRPARPGGRPGRRCRSRSRPALLALRARSEDRVEQARTSALAAAEAHAVDLLSYDHRHLDADFARAGKVLTGSFADDYARTTEYGRPARPPRRSRRSSPPTSRRPRWSGPSQNRVVVLLFVDQTTTSTRLEGPKVDLNRVRMTLVDRVDGEWLVEQGRGRARESRSVLDGDGVLRVHPARAVTTADEAPCPRRAPEGPLEVGVPSGYAVALRCHLTRPRAFAAGRPACARESPRSPRKDPSWPPRAPPASPPHQPAQHQQHRTPPHLLREDPRAPRGPEPPRPADRQLRLAARQRDVAGPGRAGPQPTAATTSRRSPASRRSSRRSARSRTSQGPCRCRSATTGSSRPSTRSRTARSGTSPTRRRCSSRPSS